MSDQKYAESRPDALHPEEPFFFLRGQDILAPFALQGYAALLRAAAAGAHGLGPLPGELTARSAHLIQQAEEVEHRAAQMVAWQARQHTKLPD